MTSKELEAMTVLSKLDNENMVVLGLVAYAMIRDDDTLKDKLVAYAHMPRTDDEDLSGAVDHELVEQVRKVCPDDEALFWGKALVHCVTRGDGAKTGELQNLMRFRVSS